MAGQASLCMLSLLESCDSNVDTDRCLLLQCDGMPAAWILAFPIHAVRVVLMELLKWCKHLYRSACTRNDMASVANALPEPRCWIEVP